MSEINIPIMGNDNICTLFDAFMQELHRLEFIYIPNGTSGLAISENFENFIEKQQPDNMVILKK